MQKKKSTATWTVGFASVARRPFAHLLCPGCGTETFFEIIGDGSVPHARCCIHEPAYPTSAKFREHLNKKPQTPEQTEAEMTGTSLFGKPLAPQLTIVARQTPSVLQRMRRKRS